MSDADLPRGWRRWLSLPSRSAAHVAKDVEDELAFHLAMREAELRAAGVDPDAATDTAHTRFGDLHTTRDQLQRAGQRREGRRRAHRWIADLRLDAYHAWRRLLREPGFSLVAVSTLALGIGATVAVASLFDRVMVSPLPYAGAERLHVVSMQSRDGSIRTSAFGPAVEAWREGVPSFERIETVHAVNVLVPDDGAHMVRPVGQVSPTLLQYLRLPAALGRTFTTDDTAATAPLVAMLSWSAWTRHHHGDPSIIGQSLTLGEKTYVIVGVMPRRFDLSLFGLVPRVDAWIPVERTADNTMIQAIAVVRPGVGLAQLQRELDAAHARLPAGVAGASLVPRITPLLELAGARTSETLRLMLAAVLLVLFIAGVNVANLLIARGAARAREWSIRRAVGASRGRLIRQLATEAMVLTGAGTLGGVALAKGLVAVAVAVRPPALGAIDDVQLDGRVAALAVGLALLIGLVFGLAPAWLTAGRETTLQVGQRSVGMNRAGHLVRRALIFAELGMSAALAVAAMLLIRSAQSVQEMRLGYDVDPIVNLSVQKAPGVADSLPVSALLAPALDRLRALPGVRGVSVAESPPGGFGGCLCAPSIEGGPLAPAEAGGFLLTQYADSAFVATAGIQLLRGRPFVSDTTAREVLITLALAARLWPQLDPLGRRFRLTNDAPLHTVVGLIEVQRSAEGWVPADSAQVILGATGPSREPSIVVRVAGSAQGAIQPIAAILRDEAPGLRAYDLRPLAATVEVARAPQRFTRWLLGAFAGVALVLAAIGRYGVMAYGVVQRHREIGVRMALGAQRSTIVRLVVGDGLRLCLAALVAGGIGSLALTRLLKGMLVGVSQWDPWSYGGAAAALLCIAMAALWLPTRRATRIDPATAVAAD